MKAGPWLRFSAVLLLCGGLFLGFVSAQPTEDKKPPQPKLLQLPAVLNKVAPENIQDLRDIEKHVQQVLKKVIPAVVGVKVGPGQGSGVIISADGYVLTAGHVSGKPDQDATIVLPDGTQLKAKTLGQYKFIDSGMLKIVLSEKDKDRKLPFLDMGKSDELKPGHWVIAIGHPGGFRSNRTPVVRVGRVLTATPFLIRTDCTLVGGDSGGPLFDMHGNVVGIHSRIGGAAITENIHVPIDTCRQTFAKLAKGESWGVALGQVETTRSAGGKKVFEKKDALTKEDPTHIAPDEKAKGTPKDIAKLSYYKSYTFRMKAGHTYTIDMVRADKKGKKQDPTKLDPFLRLESPEGKELAEDDDGAGDLDSRIVYKPIRDGDYRVVATSFEGEQTGAYTLRIFDADYVDALVAGKGDLLRAIKIPPPALGKLLEESAKAKVPLHINAVLLDSKGNPLPGKEITFSWEKGVEKLKSDKEGIVRWQLAKDKSRKLAFEIPSDASALLGLTDKDGNSLGRLFKEDKSIEAVKGAGGKIVKIFEGSLKKSDPFDVEREKCYRLIHDFKMEVGKTYTIDLISDDFDAYLRVEHEEKGKLAEDDDGGGFLNSRIVFTPTADGTYRLVVTTCDAGQFGAYRLTIRETNAKPAEPKKDEKK